jgi:hypothetical protein
VNQITNGIYSKGWPWLKSIQGCIIKLKNFEDIGAVDPGVFNNIPVKKSIRGYDTLGFKNHISHEISILFHTAETCHQHQIQLAGNVG